MKTSWKRCLTKVGYASYDDALAQCEKNRIKFDDPTLEVYLCNFTGHYHLGHLAPNTKGDTNANPTK